MHYESFHQATTIYDIVFLIFMIIMLLSMYACYRWGHNEGYQKGYHDRGVVNRKLRRGEVYRLTK